MRMIERNDEYRVVNKPRWNYDGTRKGDVIRILKVLDKNHIEFYNLSHWGNDCRKSFIASEEELNEFIGPY